MLRTWSGNRPKPPSTAPMLRPALPEFVYETKMADQKRASSTPEVLQKRIESFQASPELTGHFYLTAPKDGVVTECTARPGEVIAARTPIFGIFNPADTYAVVFFDPGDIAKVGPGNPSRSNSRHRQTGDRHGDGFLSGAIGAPEFADPLFLAEGEVVAIRPRAARLYQSGQATQRNKLFACRHNYQLSRWQWSGTRRTALGSWRWVLNQLNGAWQFVSASFAQQSMDR